MSQRAVVGPLAGASVEVEAEPGSALFDLRAVREEKLAKLHIDLPVPRWGEPGDEGKPTPKIFVRYGPSDPAWALKAAEKRRRENDPDWVVNVNADVLARACIGVYAMLPGDPTRYSLRQGDPVGVWTKFDKDLAQALGLDSSRAVEVVKALYLTSGDLVSAAAQIGEWSGVSMPKVDEDSLGE